MASRLVQESMDEGIKLVRKIRSSPLNESNIAKRNKELTRTKIQ